MSRPVVVLAALPILLATACSSSSLDGTVKHDTDVTDTVDAPDAADAQDTIPTDTPTTDPSPDSDLPVCTGVATWDLGPCDPEGDEWYHGEHMCSQQVHCGDILSCAAYSDWPYGSCVCPRPEYTGDLAVTSPEEDALLTMADDEDPAAPGLQVEVEIDAGCWMDYEFAWALTMGVSGEPSTDSEDLFVPGADGHAVRVMDLGGASGTVRICVWPVVDGGIERGAAVTVDVGV